MAKNKMTLVLILVLFSQYSFAGLKIVSLYTENGKGQTQINLLDNNQAKFINPGKGSVLYKKSSNEVYVLNAKTKKAISLNDKFLKNMDNVIQKMGPTIKKFLNQMSDEQKKAMEAKLKTMTKGKASTFDEALTKLNKKHSYSFIPKESVVPVKHLNWECQLVDALMDGKRVAELCIASFEALGLKGNYHGMISFMRSKMKSLLKYLGTDAMTSLHDVILKVNGFPLVVKWYSGGKMTKKLSVTKLVEEELSSSLFEVPSSYDKTGIPMPTDDASKE